MNELIFILLAVALFVLLIVLDRLPQLLAWRDRRKESQLRRNAQERRLNHVKHMEALR